MRCSSVLLLSLTLIAGFSESSSAQTVVEAPARRAVLVELYTSQGCDMCPEAEKILGQLARGHSSIVPIAFHVDYFNDPWKDQFSDPVYSRRQAVYNSLYTKPKHPAYGLYYTPMLMIDGEQSVNGRDLSTAEAAIRQALKKKPLVRLDTKLELKSDPRFGEVRISVVARSSRVQGRELLVCVVLREDGVTTKIGSGENAGKTLTASYPAKKLQHEFIKLKGESPAAVRFAFELEPASNVEKSRLAVFVQDKQTAVVYQAADLPWK